MKWASSQTAYEMSGHVQVAKYMHLPTIAQKEREATASHSASVEGDMSAVRHHFGQGVVTALHSSILKCQRMDEVNWA